MAETNTHTKNDNSAVKRIWTVFVILSIVTIVEVLLGIFRPDFLVHTDFVYLSLLNWIFILLTIYKAYYIVWAFMHMEHETKGLRRAIIWTSGFLIIYLVFIFLTEGNYIYNVMKNGFVAWDF
ncbi:cytochrome C oxidase subunit IV family protein [Haloflavibacter putidus]|uniref:Cytochrome C oxidase subunit IV n=1 Tax=Haloflavibacter putidus TaxID=2576776 RepID=A0A507ZV58_9FLAO|nr:cytochrome C oxidase subunit IV family protein [Haloflavibacter putidus]TQD39628.1 cytochrome C oxidase subunit IV [Haloflavibacter putidus]